MYVEPLELKLWCGVVQMQNYINCVIDQIPIGRIQVLFLQLSSPLGPDFVWIPSVKSVVVATHYEHATYFSFCCTSYVSLGCDSALRNPLPDSRGVQFECSWCQKLWFIIYLFVSLCGIHIKHESRVTRFPTFQTDTEQAIISGVSVPW